jgi:ABC-type bacteriocin/lantibiotic exporter with double-glycine peptidase domain
MMNWRLWIARLFVTTAIVLSARKGFADRPVTDGHSHDPFCGPRAAHYVLERYGLNADLVTLIGDIQWPNVENGVSLDAIDKALQKHGINTCPVVLSENTYLTSKNPVIVHFVDRDTDGHFVVWLGSNPNGDGEVIYDGLRGKRQISTADFRRRCSGYMLLTSRANVADSWKAIASVDRLLLIILVLAGGVIVFRGCKHIVSFRRVCKGNGS